MKTPKVRIFGTISHKRDGREYRLIIEIDGTEYRTLHLKMTEVVEELKKKFEDELSSKFTKDERKRIEIFTNPDCEFEITEKGAFSNSKLEQGEKRLLWELIKGEFKSPLTPLY
jgi:hypothetical protein